MGRDFWDRRYWVSTVRRDEAAIREYIRNQEHEDERFGPDRTVALNDHRSGGSNPSGPP